MGVLRPPGGLPTVVRIVVLVVFAIQATLASRLPAGRGGLDCPLKPRRPREGRRRGPSSAGHAVWPSRVAFSGSA